MLVHLSATEVHVRPRTPMERVRFGSMSMWVRVSLTPTTGPLSAPSFRFAVRRGCRRRWSCIRAAVGTATGRLKELSPQATGKFWRKDLKRRASDTAYKLIRRAQQIYQVSCGLPAHRTTSESFRYWSSLSMYQNSQLPFRQRRIAWAGSPRHLNPAWQRLTAP